MPRFVDFADGIGRFAAAPGHLASDPHAEPLAPDAWSPESGAPLLLAGDAEPETRFVSAPMVQVHFPAFHDGRGLSLAVLLRTRFGYTGELRAVGDIRPDLLHYLERCGFDSFIPAPGVTLHPEDPSLAPHRGHYQASVVQPTPIFRRPERSA